MERVEILISKTPSTLVKAVIEARRQGNQGLFQRKLKKFLKSKQLPKWWTRLLQGLAEKKALMTIMNEQKLFPTGFCCLNALANLEDCGFPNSFLKELSEEASSELGPTKYQFF